ncbi:MAG: hypothetical protein ACLPJH_07240 [Myxococcaceae bacterium]
MGKRHLMAVLVAGLGVAAATGCQDLNYDCAGICGDTVGNGDFEGVIAAASEVDAINQCLSKLGCDAGFQANCNCYLQQTEVQATHPNQASQ